MESSLEHLIGKPVFTVIRTDWHVTKVSGILEKTPDGKYAIVFGSVFCVFTEYAVSKITYGSLTQPAEIILK